MKDVAKISIYDDARCNDNICSKMKTGPTLSSNSQETLCRQRNSALTAQPRDATDAFA